MANKIGDGGRLVSTSYPCAPPRRTALARDLERRRGYYPATASPIAVVAVDTAGNLKTPAKMPELSERTCLHVLVHGIRYRSHNKHRRWYFPSSRMSRIKKVWGKEKKDDEIEARKMDDVEIRCWNIVVTSMDDQVVETLYRT